MGCSVGSGVGVSIVWKYRLLRQGKSFWTLKKYNAVRYPKQVLAIRLLATKEIAAKDAAAAYLKALPAPVQAIEG
jgi:hypothetical protein